MDWNKEGQTISAVYQGYPVTGVVTLSRVKYGGRVQHSVKLETPVQLRWRTEPTFDLLIDEDEVLSAEFVDPDAALNDFNYVGSRHHY